MASSLGPSWTNDLTVAIPGKALLELASDLLWALDQSYLAQEDQVEANDDDDGNGYCELMSLRADLSHVQYRLDPYRWALERTRHGGSQPHLSCWTRCLTTEFNDIPSLSFSIDAVTVQAGR